jgi:hypothetical protein
MTVIAQPKLVTKQKKKTNNNELKTKHHVHVIAICNQLYTYTTGEYEKAYFNTEANNRRQENGENHHIDRELKKYGLK